MHFFILKNISGIQTIIIHYETLNKKYATQNGLKLKYNIIGTQKLSFKQN